MWLSAALLTPPLSTSASLTQHCTSTSSLWDVACGLCLRQPLPPAAVARRCTPWVCVIPPQPLRSRAWQQPCCVSFCCSSCVEMHSNGLATDHFFLLAAVLQGLLACLHHQLHHNGSVHRGLQELPRCPGDDCHVVRRFFSSHRVDTPLHIVSRRNASPRRALRVKGPKMSKTSRHLLQPKQRFSKLSASSVARRHQHLCHIRQKLGQCALSLLRLGQKLLARVCDFQLYSCSRLSACACLVQPYARLAGYQAFLLLWPTSNRIHFFVPHLPGVGC